MKFVYKMQPNEAYLHSSLQELSFLLQKEMKWLDLFILGKYPDIPDKLNYLKRILLPRSFNFGGESNMCNLKSSMISFSR